MRYLRKTHKGLLVLRQVNGQWVYCEEESQTPYSLNAHGIKPGDLFHFGDQVAVFYGEGGPKDILNPEDQMFYSFNQTPRISTIGESEFKNRPMKVYKWARSLVGS